MRVRLKLALTLGGLLMWPSVSVRAQGPSGQEPPATDAALAALVAEALANNPALRVAQETVAVARTRPEQARSLPDPMLSVQYTNDGWSPTLGEREMSTLAFMGSQTLPWPGKRSLREGIAARDLVEQNERLARVRLSVVAGVERAFWALALARATLDLLAEQAQIWKEAEGVARGRYAVGEGAQQDVLRAQVELTRFGQLRAEQEAEAESRRAELNLLLGRPADAAPPPTPSLVLRPLTAGFTALAAEAEARSPELRAWAAAGDRARLSAELAQREFRPDLTLQAGYMNRGGLDPMWQAGVGINLPVYRGRRRAAASRHARPSRCARSCATGRRRDWRN